MMNQEERKEIAMKEVTMGINSSHTKIKNTITLEEAEKSQVMIGTMKIREIRTKYHPNILIKIKEEVSIKNITKRITIEEDLREKIVITKISIMKKDGKQIGILKKVTLTKEIEMVVTKGIQETKMIVTSRKNIKIIMVVDTKMITMKIEAVT